MSDEQMLDAIGSGAHAAAAIGVFFNHAFCLLAQHTAVDLPSLIDGIRNLPRGNRHPAFEAVYERNKNLLASNLEEILKKQAPDQTA
jgi:hypothetical protein